MSETDADHLSSRNGKAKILVVDDHSIVRQGLKQLINQEDDLMVCAEAASAEEAMRIVASQPVDLAIIDISLEDKTGIQLTEELTSKYHNLPVLILTMHDSALYAKRAFEVGAKGYVTKGEVTDAVITAIRMVLSGKTYISDKTAEKFFQNYM
jgi:DNA-binding NarL/FixJ family response regulator